MQKAWKGQGGVHTTQIAAIVLSRKHLAGKPGRIRTTRQGPWSRRYCFMFVADMLTTVHSCHPHIYISFTCYIHIRYRSCWKKACREAQSACIHRARESPARRALDAAAGPAVPAVPAERTARSSDIPRRKASPQMDGFRNRNIYLYICMY